MKKTIQKMTYWTNQLYKLHRWIIMVAIWLSLPLIGFFVYTTGGIKFVFSHTMYMPIVLSGLIFGGTWGIVIGAVAGLIVGPWMPLDIMTGEMQLWYNWFYRLIIFIIIGWLSGYASTLLRRHAKTISTLYSINPETKIPNTNYLMSYAHCFKEASDCLTISIMVNNYEQIIDLLGIEHYHQLLYGLFQKLEKNIENEKVIVQADNNKFWIAIHSPEMHDVIDGIFALLHEEIIINQIPLYIEFSIGVAPITKDDTEHILNPFKKSDIAARQAQKDNVPYIIFDKSLLINHRELALLGVFVRALNDQDTFLSYQPIIDYKSGKVIALEALIRWNHQQLGLIMPDEFVPLVEETQLIHFLTEWVLKTAIDKVKELHTKGIFIPVSINISAKNLHDTQLFDRILRITKEASMDAKWIEFEIVETALMTNPEASKELLKNLSQYGFTIALDDFGKGYSSLSYLSEFMIHVIKLDKYFMSQIDSDPSVQHIVKATIDLAHKLGYRVVAEGIEDQVVAEMVKDFGCDYGQGYYFSRPIKDNDIFKWLKKHENHSFLTK